MREVFHLPEHHRPLSELLPQLPEDPPGSHEGQIQPEGGEITLRLPLPTPINVNDALSLCSMSIASETQNIVILRGFAGFSICS